MTENIERLTSHLNDTIVGKEKIWEEQEKKAAEIEEGMQRLSNPGRKQ